MGEKQGERKKIDTFTKHLIDNGNDPKYARRKARELAREADKKLTRKNK